MNKIKLFDGHALIASGVMMLTVALLLGFSGGARAADIYSGGLKDGPAAVATERGPNWTGFYIGGRVGYGNANHDLTVQDYFKDYCTDNAGDEDFVAGETDRRFTLDNKNKKFDTSFTSCEQGDWRDREHSTVKGVSHDVANLDGLNSRGVVGGIQLGADYQIGRFVGGVFGSYDLASMETEGSVADFASFSIEKGDEWSLGARAGFLATPRTMVYALAAYTQTEYDFRAAIGDEGGKKTVDFDGVSVGGGIEVALTDTVFLGAEYQHTFYGKETLIDDYRAERNRGTRLVDDLDEDKVMATLKFKLNGSLLGN